MKQKNKARRLMGRQLDFLRGPTTSSVDGKKLLRWETRGFHKPGSNNK